MDDLEKYIEKRKSKSKKFAKEFEEGYEIFKIGIELRKAREEAGITQEELAKRLRTKKSASNLKRKARKILSKVPSRAVPLWDSKE